MGKQGGGRRRAPAAERWYAVWGPHQGVYQGWGIAQPLSQGIPGDAGAVEVASPQAGHEYLARRASSCDTSHPAAPHHAAAAERKSEAEAEAPEEETKVSAG